MNAPVQLTPQTKDLMLLGMCRIERVALRALSKVEPEDFDRVLEQHMAVVWSAARDFYRSYSRLATPKELIAEVSSRVHGDPDCEIGSQKYQLLDETLGVVCGATDEQVASLVPEYCLNILQTFIDERKVRPLAKAGATQSLPKMLQDVHQAYVSTRLSSNASSDPFDLSDPTLEEIQLPRRATGLECFDMLVGAGEGPRPSELIGLLGPIGGGKTLVQIQTVINVALGRGYAHFFTYEQPVAPEIRERCWIGMTNVDRGLIQGKTFSSIDPATQDILKQAQTRMKGYLHLHDFSGGSAGWGGVDEIEAVVAEHVATDRRPNIVCVDWAGIMAQRMMMKNNVSDAAMKRSYILMICDQLRSMAQKYEVPVVLAHQLASSAGEKPLTGELTQYDASDCKQFSAVCSACVVIGKMDPKSKMLKMSNPKTRAGSQMSIMCKVDDRKHQITVDRNEYTVSYGKDGVATYVKASQMSRLDTARGISTLPTNLSGPSPAVAPSAPVAATLLAPPMPGYVPPPIVDDV